MGENKILIEIEKTKIDQKNWVPTPPTPEGVWANKRDHDVFQEIVSLATKLGGAGSNTGCPTKSAERARQDAERRYYQLQIKYFKKENTEKKIG